MTAADVREAHWAPVSAGEYDRRTRIISVNVAVVERVCARYGHDRAAVIAAIVAHERSHASSRPGTLPQVEERRAREAAAAVAGHELVAHIDEVLAEAWA